MRRHDALIPLTHDHHHALAQVRRMKLATKSGTDEDRLDRAHEFLRFFADDTLVHFREEEEKVFPLLLEGSEEVPELLTRVLVDHVRIHSKVTRLEAEARAGTVESRSLLDVAELLERHIKVEEKELFPLIERVASQESLGRVQLAPRDRD